MQERMIVTYCIPCEIVYNTSKPQTNCGICNGKLKEIGFVEYEG
jgi:rubredoxin